MDDQRDRKGTDDDELDEVGEADVDLEAEADDADEMADGDWTKEEKEY